MKRSELIFNIVSIPIDIISLFVAGLVSFYLRLALNNEIPVLFAPNLHSFLHDLWYSVLILLIIFALAGLYNLRGTRRFSREFLKITASVSTALLLIILVFFFNQNVFNSRLTILIAWPASIILVVIGRFIVLKIQQAFLRRGFGLHNLVIIKGSLPQANAFLHDTVYKKQFGYKIVAEINGVNNTLTELKKIYEPNKFEEVLQANPLADPKDNADILLFCRQHGLTFNYLPNIFDVQKNHIETDTISGMPIISIKNTPLNGWGSLVKRVFDVIASLICIIITLPAFIVIAIAIKIDSPGKILYAAERGGLKTDFMFYKFRTMYNHLSIGNGYGGARAEEMRRELWKKNARGGANAAFLKIKHDPRVTRVGRFLRKTKLDEIPQFYNVLKGDMSMVGPRAHVVEEVERYREHYRRVFSIKPGIFGLSQIAQISWPDLPFEEEIKLNTYYIENWSLWLDITILFKSFYLLFFGKAAQEDY